jgi:hypothetical protein
MERCTIPAIDTQTEYRVALKLMRRSSNPLLTNLKPKTERNSKILSLQDNCPIYPK